MNIQEQIIATMQRLIAQQSAKTQDESTKWIVLPMWKWQMEIGADCSPAVLASEFKKLEKDGSIQSKKAFESPINHAKAYTLGNAIVTHISSNSHNVTPAKQCDSTAAAANTLGNVTAKYDTNNVFARILRGELSCDKVYEDDFVLAFKDLYPAAKIHILVLPKGEFISFNDFITTATATEIEHFFKTAQQIAKSKDIDKTGYRIVMNHEKHAMQAIPHFHLHILGGEQLC